MLPFFPIPGFGLVLLGLVGALFLLGGVRDVAGARERPYCLDRWSCRAAAMRVWLVWAGLRDEPELFDTP